MIRFLVIVLTALSLHGGEVTVFRIEPAKCEVIPQLDVSGEWPDFAQGCELAFAGGSLRVLCSAKELYLQTVLPCKDAPVAKRKNADEPFDGEDAVIFRIDPNCAGLNTIFIGVNPDGVKSDGVSYSYRPNFPARIRTEVRDGVWTLAVALPLESLGIRADLGTLAGLSAKRLRPGQKTLEMPEQSLLLGHAEADLRLAVRGGKLAVRSADAADGTLIWRLGGELRQTPLLFRNHWAEATLPQQLTGDFPLTIVTRSRDGALRVNRATAEYFRDWYGGKARGARLATQDGTVFWTSSNMDKVLPEAELPDAQTSELACSLAANEYEGIALHLTPERERRFRVRAGELRSDAGAVIPADAIRLYALETVPVTRASDRMGHRGDWPDPLIPLADGELHAAANRTSTLYLQLFAPPGTPGGVYRGSLTLEADGQKTTLPMTVSVYGFELPDDTGTATMYAIWKQFFPYQKLEREEDIETHLRNFFALMRRYRLNPGNVFTGVTIPFRDGKCDFTAFDRRAKLVFDEMKFAPVNLAYFLLKPPFRFDEPLKNDAEKQAVKEAYRQVVEHLKRNGWLDKCVWYDVDEPAPATYPKVRRHLDLTRELLPGVKRLVVICHSATAPELEGAVELWVPILNHYRPEYWAKRRAMGEEVWWYVCNFPQAPYPTNFIDAPGIMPRIRFWMAERYGVTGSLYWAVDYLGKNPDGTVRDPWTTPFILGVSNGDGMLVYPPCRTPAKTPATDAPWPSIRLEQLRDGLEDREYFRLGRAELARLRASGKAPQLQRELAAQLTDLPAKLAPGLSTYERNPETLLAARARLARLIEQAKGVNP